MPRGRRERELESSDFLSVRLFLPVPVHFVVGYRELLVC